MNLDKPFCGTQRDCFGGILGAQSPYNDQVRYPGNVSILLHYTGTFLDQGTLPKMYSTGSMLQLY